MWRRWHGCREGRGSWLASWYAADGRRVQRKIGPARTESRSDGLTKAQAEKALRRIREIEAPHAVARGRRVTMAEAGAELCRRLELKGRKKSHRLTVASDLRNHIEPFFGERAIDRITPDDIERYAAVKKRTLAIKTIRNHIGTMHSIFEVSVRKGWCQSNPVTLADHATFPLDGERRPVVGVGGERVGQLVTLAEHHLELGLLLGTAVALDRHDSGDQTGSHHRLSSIDQHRYRAY